MLELLTINGKQLPYPNEFTMTKTMNIVSELTTMSGKLIADFNGWVYKDTVIEWGVLEYDDLQLLIEAIADTEFSIIFRNPDGNTEEVRAILRNFNHMKTVCQNDGHFVWKSVSIEVSFPDCYHD